MTFDIHITPSWKSQEVEEKLKDFKHFCHLFSIPILKEGQAHYRNELLVRLDSDEHTMCHQLNALVAYSHLHKVAVKARQS